MGERTCRTDTRIRARDENPCVWREREAEVGDHGEAIGVDGGEAECWTPSMEFEGHGWKDIVWWSGLFTLDEGPLCL